MALFQTNDESREVPDGTKLEETAEAMGVSFGCHHGVCGACVVPVLTGMENLNAMTEAEEEFEVEDGQRMMCQCTINGGTVKVDA